MNQRAAEIVLQIARIGRDHPAVPPLDQVEPLEHYFANGALHASGLDKRDGCCTRREVLTRFLLLLAVLDQGPDITGLRDMLIRMTNALYRREVRFIHRPEDLFQSIGLAVDLLIRSHQSVRAIRADIWAQENFSSPSRYNLLQYDRNVTKPLHYLVARWGVPLLLPLFLSQDPFPVAPLDQIHRLENPTLLLDYLEQWPSAEIMSRQLKEHPRYGLGKAIGDKACHLFTKWLVSTYRLTRRVEDPGWSDFSYEVPYDSNAGRVLWRTGYLLLWGDEHYYERKGVIRRREGKGGSDYLRVTRIRGLGSVTPLSAQEEKIYKALVLQYLKTHQKPPQKTEIQRIQHIYLLDYSLHHPEDKLTVAHFDDGLMYVGTRYCLNHDQPRCEGCPLQDVCVGYQERPELISRYRT